MTIRVRTCCVDFWGFSAGETLSEIFDQQRNTFKSVGILLSIFVVDCSVQFEWIMTCYRYASLYSTSQVENKNLISSNELIKIELPL